MKLIKKDYFITTPDIAHFSKLHTGMEKDVLMSSSKEVKSISENKNAQKQL